MSNIFCLQTFYVSGASYNMSNNTRSTSDFSANWYFMLDIICFI